MSLSPAAILHDTSGNEKGITGNPVKVDPTGTTAQPVTDNGGTLSVDDGGGSVTVDGSVAVSNLPAVQPVNDNGGSLTVDSPQLPAALVGARLDINAGAWLGSTAPTVGQKSAANSIPVVLASDQTTTFVEVEDHPTFTLTAGAIAIGNNKSMITLLNGVSSTKILRVREIYIVNSQTGAVTGVIATIGLRRTTGFTGGTSLTPVSNDTADTLDVNVTAATGATVSGESAAFIQRWYISTDDWGTGTLDVEALQATFQSYNPAFTRRDTETRPLTLRAGQGITVKCETNSTAGAFDIVVVFTQE